MTYYVEEFTYELEDEDDDPPSWSADDWCYLVKVDGDEIICICATQAEADHIADLLRKFPIAS